ncbi:MAG: DNA-directed RNA polymerase subunit alpha [Candidatus Paceibacterota bacterium]|jgi:DNA-directed RNA polymerase subunit alpha
MAHEINLPQAQRVTQKNDNLATIQIDGCHPGYGITLANALRRVLYSSLPGTAIVAFKTKGINHEFSTIPHVIEDIIQIGLSLKKVRLLSNENLIDKQVQATLKIKGEKVVKAGDIQTPSGIEIINKDLVIATLSDKKAELDMEIFISGGFGYERVEDRQKEKLSIGTIALDAFYSPITRVNYKIEDMRIGERTDFNRVIMEIETDGSIEASEALKNASAILRDQFGFLASFKEASLLKTKKASKTKKETVLEKKGKDSKKELPKAKIEDLGLEERVVKLLEEAGIKTISVLTKKTESQIKEIKGIGDKAVSTIKRKLKKIDLSFKS